MERARSHRPGPPPSPAPIGTPRRPAGDVAPVAGSLTVATPAGRLVLLATILGSGIAMLDGTVVNAALPRIGRDLGATFGDLQWVVNGYLLTLSAFLLLGGSLGDRLGRRRVFVVGVTWFVVASALCAAAPSTGTLVAARVVQGVGGALLTPGSLAILQASFAPDQRARAIGLWSGLSGVAIALGPFVGGYLIDAVSWRLVFLINLPIGAVVVWLAVRHVPESREPDVRGSVDVLGALACAAALALLTYALIAAGTGWSVTVVAAALLGLLAAVGFVLLELRVVAPMLPPGLFRSRLFTAVNLVTFLVYAALGGMSFLLIVELQTVLGYSALQAGAALLPATVLLMLLSGRAGALAQRVGPRLPMTVGPALAAVGVAVLAFVGPGDAYVTAVLPGVLLFGLGLSATVAPLTATVLAAADQRHIGVASAVNNAVARTGSLLAVATLPLLGGIAGADYRDPPRFEAGYRTAVLVAAGLLLAGAVLSLLTVRPAGNAVSSS